MELIRPLSDAINAGDLSKIRAALITCVDLDAHYEKPEALIIADNVSEKMKSQNISLYEPDNGRLSFDLSGASADEWNKAKASLRLNFSREKIEYATKLVETLRKKGVPGFDISRKARTEGTRVGNVPPQRLKQSSSQSPDMAREYGFNKPLANAVASGSVSDARAAIITHADSDYFDGTANALSIADKASELLKSKGIDLFVPDNGSISFSGEVWNESDWNRAKAALRLNFSREKLQYVTKLVGKHRRPQPTSTVSPTNYPQRGSTISGSSTGSRRGTRPSIRRRDNRQSTIVTGVVVGVVVGGVVGAAVGATVAGAIIGGAVAGGVTFYKK